MTDSKTNHSNLSTSVHDGGVGVITLHNGKVNALGRLLLEDLIGALEDLQKTGVRVAVLRAAAGARVFSAGHDVRELPTDGRDPLAEDEPLRRAIRAIQTAPVPVIAMVEGTVWGGACELVLVCDLVVAGEDSTFAFTPARLGVPYDLAGTLNLLNAVGLRLAQEMFYLAEPVPAPRLEACGAISRAVPRAKLEETAMHMARTVAANAPLVNQVAKEHLRALAEARPLDGKILERLATLRRAAYTGEDYREGVRTFFDKRQPQFRGR